MSKVASADFADDAGVAVVVLGQFEVEVGVAVLDLVLEPGARLGGDVDEDARIVAVARVGGEVPELLAGLPNVEDGGAARQDVRVRAEALGVDRVADDVEGRVREDGLGALVVGVRNGVVDEAAVGVRVAARRHRDFVAQFHRPSSKIETRDRDDIVRNGGAELGGGVDEVAARRGGKVHGGVDGAADAGFAPGRKGRADSQREAGVGLARERLDDSQEFREGVSDAGKVREGDATPVFAGVDVDAGEEGGAAVGRVAAEEGVAAVGGRGHVAGEGEVFGVGVGVAAARQGTGEELVAVGVEGEAEEGQEDEGDGDADEGVLEGRGGKGLGEGVGLFVVVGVRDRGRRRFDESGVVEDVAGS
mmetsp:Transcript_13187/g.39876  ORF Transcript_13187/g.39876 Transcript_13187/m.39876 type:complete len:362 (+) Transcript_13187:394-1479(+)